MIGAGAARTIRIGLVVLTALIGLGGVASGQTSTPMIVRLTLDGVVDPFVANHISSVIGDSASGDGVAVLLDIDTPGGLDSSMRQITQSILNAPVPVICYVAPQGARAASAGAFVLMSCPIAAMAPGTNVGAASPVGLSGAVESEKAMNDAAAYMRSLAEFRGRNAGVAETFVRDATSITAEDALREHVIDLISPSERTLLATISGRTVTLADGKAVVLDTTGATIVDRSMGVVASFLHQLFDPNLAFLFFWLGLVLVVVELLFPGHIVSGLIGVSLLVVAIVSFGLLPVRLAGIGLLALSVLFFLLEARHPGLGAWGVLGLITLVLGGLFLFNGTGGVHVSPFVIAPVALAAVAFFGYATTKAMAIRRMAPPPGTERIIGREGVVVGAGLDPEGVVRVDAEQWKATSTGVSIPPGSKIKVVRIDGLALTVEPLAEEREPPASADAAAEAEGGNAR